MTEKQAEELIKQAWKDGWEALHPADPEDDDHVPYCFDDEPFTSDDHASWVRVAINPSTRDEATMGENAKFDHRGTIMVQVFGPPGQGGAFVIGLADDVRTVLERKRFEDVVTRAGATRKMDAGDPRWAARMVTVPYAIDVQT